MSVCDVTWDSGAPRLLLEVHLSCCWLVDVVGIFLDATSVGDSDVLRIFDAEALCVWGDVAATSEEWQESMDGARSTSDEDASDVLLTLLYSGAADVPDDDD